MTVLRFPPAKVLPNLSMRVPSTNGEGDVVGFPDALGQLDDRFFVSLIFFRLPTRVGAQLDL